MDQVKDQCMWRECRIVVVLPAYNAEKTLLATIADIRDQGIVDRMILVDDCSRDETVRLALECGDVRVHRHDRNTGYGGNQKTCYRLALEDGADIVIMVHPDYQYTPLLIPAMAALVGSGLYDLVLGSRILGGQALAGGMPLWKYVANRALTGLENVLCGSKLSEYHTGYRAYSKRLLESLRLEECSDDFVFDNQVIAQVLAGGFSIGEISCPTKYFADASSIDFVRSIAYGLGCLNVACAYCVARFLPGLKPLYLTPKRTRSEWDGCPVP